MQHVNSDSQQGNMGAKGGGLIGDAPTIVVTPKSKPPNVIPFNEAAAVNHLNNQQRKKHIVHPLEERIDAGNGGDGDDGDDAQTAIRTPQQILREKIFGGSKQGRIDRNSTEHLPSLTTFSAKIQNLITESISMLREMIWSGL